MIAEMLRDDATHQNSQTHAHIPTDEHGGIGGAALGVRCGSAFHVVWNQERNAAGLDQLESHDTDGAIRVVIEAIKTLIRQDRGEI